MPNELYAQNMEYRHQYDEIIKHLSQGHLKGTGWVQKDLQLHNINVASYYTDKYALWLDFRTIDDNALHGSGRQLENTLEGIRLQITKRLNQLVVNFHAISIYFRMLKLTLVISSF